MNIIDASVVVTRPGYGGRIKVKLDSNAGPGIRLTKNNINGLNGTLAIHEPNATLTIAPCPYHPCAIM